MSELTDSIRLIEPSTGGFPSSKLLQKQQEENVFEDDEFDEEERFQLGIDWRRQLMPRTVIGGLLIGTILSVVYVKLVLAYPLIPSLNIAAGILGFSLVKPLVKLLTKCMSEVVPYSKQENTVIQTFAVAMYQVAWTTGIGSYYMGMTETIIGPINKDNEAKGLPPQAFITPNYGQLVGMAFCVSFFGLFMLLQVRKLYIITLRDKLIFPSGTATGVMINNFFTTNGGAYVARQYGIFKRWAGINFVWDIFQWIYSAGSGSFNEWPIFGLKADELFGMSYDFGLSSIAIGLIVPTSVNWSIFLGSLASGFLFTDTGAGLLPLNDWFPDETVYGGPANETNPYNHLASKNVGGTKGLMIFSFISILFADGFYQVGKAVYSVWKMRKEAASSKTGPASPTGSEDAVKSERAIRLDRLRVRIFNAVHIPWYWSAIGLSVFALAAIFGIPALFPQGAKWYMVIVALLFIPLIGIPSAYLMGMTDTDCSAVFAKLPVLIFGVWAGHVEPSSGIVAAMSLMGVILSGSSQASLLLQDFKTGFYTESSPMAMIIAQILGGVFGCVITPAIFWIFYTAFAPGTEGSEYPVPYASAYAGIAMIGVEGFSALPMHSGEFMAFFFFFSIFWSAMTDVVSCFILKTDYQKEMWRTWVPSPMAFGMGLYSGGAFGWPFFVVMIIKMVWGLYNKDDMEESAVSVASGILVGDGVWALISALLSLGGVDSPIGFAFAPGN